MLTKPWDVVIACENSLGLTYDNKLPLWKARIEQASILKKKIAENPTLYTFRNLEATIAMLAHKRRPIVSAASICWFVEDAIEQMAVVEEPDPFQDAIDWERAHPRRESTYWLGRFVRTHPTLVEEVLAEWRASCV